MNNFISNYRLEPQEAIAQLTPRQMVVNELRRLAQKWEKKRPDYDAINNEELARRSFRSLSKRIAEVFKTHPNAVHKFLQQVIEATCARMEQRALAASPQNWDPRHFWTVSKRLYVEFVDGIGQIETL